MNTIVSQYKLTNMAVLLVVLPWNVVYTLRSQDDEWLTFCQTAIMLTFLLLLNRLDNY